MTSQPRARETLVTALALVVLALLAWGYLWIGAGTGMSGLDMTALALFPHRAVAAMAMPGMDGMASMRASFVLDALAALSMWWVMMVAMMTPAAAPLVLLYARSAARAAPTTPPWIATGALVAGYLTAWLAFSAVAAALELALARSGVLSPTMLWSRSAAWSAGILALAGLYQLSPLKHACLRHCRTPLAFIAAHWRPGPRGAWSIGLRHGAWCVGCCGMLMALLFVGGLMNLAWIGVLAILVLVEKVSPDGVMVSKAAGVLLLVWAAATLLA